jgi:hypothetical protein
MKRSVKKQRSHAKNKQRSPAKNKKRRSPKRKYRMNNTQQVTVKPMVGDDIVIDLPANATVGELRQRVDDINPVSADSFNQLFVQRQGDYDGTNPIVLSDDNLVSAYGNEIYLTASPKSFIVRTRLMGGAGGTHGPFRTEEEALRKTWIISNELIRSIRQNPRQPYLNQDYLNLRHLQIDDNFIPQTLAQLTERLDQIWGGAFSFMFLRVSTRGSYVCICGRAH